MPDAIPSYYTREDTLAGPLYFYPRPAVTQQAEHPWSPPRRQITWSATRPGGAVAVDERGSYLVTTQPVDVFVANWEESRGVSHYEIKPEDKLSAIARQLMASGEYPATLTPDGWHQRCEYPEGDGECGECAWCEIRRSMYSPVHNPPSVRTSKHRVTHLLELPVAADPYPNWSWTMDNPALASFYPSQAARLFPGYTTGVRDAVLIRVRKVMADLALPETTVHDWSHSNEVSVSCQLPWDRPREWTALKGRRDKIREINTRRRREAFFGAHWRQTVKVADRLTGESKSDAMARLDSVVQSYVDKLVPPHTEVCGTCSGRGYTK